MAWLGKKVLSRESKRERRPRSLKTHGGGLPPKNPSVGQGGEVGKKKQRTKDERASRRVAGTHGKTNQPLPEMAEEINPRKTGEGRIKRHLRSVKRKKKNVTLLWRRIPK